MELTNFNSRQFYDLGKLHFPRIIRTYIDGNAFEYKAISTKEKIFHFAFLFSHGFDVKSTIETDVKSHMENPQYWDYYDTTRYSIIEYICLTRNNFIYENESSIYIESLSLSELLDLLKEELLLRYREYTLNRNPDNYSYEFKYCKFDIYDILNRPEFQNNSKGLTDYLSTSEETLRNIEFTDEDIRLINGWRFPAQKLNFSYLKKEGEHFIYPGDEKAVEFYNAKKNEKNKFQTEIHPEPFFGDVLNAKVILLSLNPGFIEKNNFHMVKSMRANQLEQYVFPMQSQLLLKGHGFFEFKEQEMISTKYWYNCIRQLNADIYGKETAKGIYWPICKDVAIIQYIGYLSSKWSDLPKKYEFQSQWFTKLLIRYLAKKSDNTLFVITRGTKKWLELIDKDVLEYLGDRIIYRETELGTTSRSQYITPMNLGPNNYERIIENIGNTKTKKHLQNALNSFKGMFGTESLEEQFKKIAEAIFSGHFLVKGNGVERKIHPLTIEFYYHEEDRDNANGREVDWIMYHRGTGKKAYPLGSINAHVSGIDITFEDQRSNPRYRASALIREFEVKGDGNELLEFNENEHRSTKMYDALLMGISIFDGGFNISWVDDDLNTDVITQHYRQNVAIVSEKNGKVLYNEQPQGLEKKYYLDDHHFKIKIGKQSYLHDGRKWQYSVIKDKTDDPIESNE